MQLIQTISLTGSQSSIEFTAIPQSFDDLYLVFSARTSNEPDGNGYGVAQISFNGLTTNRSNRRLVGSGANTFSFATSDMQIFTSGNTNTANTFGSANLYIPNYKAATAKSVSIDHVTETNATQAWQFLTAGLWNDTAAITSLTFTAASSGQFVAGSSASLYGIKNFITSKAKATGGSISFDAVNNKVIHTFTASGTFTPTENISGVEYLVVAGGGGGAEAANAVGGGGGAGGYRSSVVGESSGGGASAESTLSVTAQPYTVTIGAGGAGGIGGQTQTSGSDSVFGSITALGGGRGGATTTAQVGGSGGGAGMSSQSGASGTANQGFGGGSSSSDGRLGGGGGGAGAVGQNGVVDGGQMGLGGNGVQSSITGTGVFRAGGGGGGGNVVGGIPGGSGGGGTGARDSVSHGTPGTANTGGGGGGGRGGAAASRNGAAGGSGIVIVRYSA